MNINEIKEKREDILRIAKKYGAYNIRVFGSVVRGEDRIAILIFLLILSLIEAY